MSVHLTLPSEPALSAVLSSGEFRGRTWETDRPYRCSHNPWCRKWGRFNCAGEACKSLIRRCIVNTKAQRYCVLVVTTFVLCTATLGDACAEDQTGRSAMIADVGRTPPCIIFDTDFRADCDDVGALAVLHKMADAGECKILGIVTSTTGPKIVAAIDAVNTYYGRPNLPIGLCPVPHTEHFDPYAPHLGNPANFASDQTNTTAPDSVALYRKMLHEAPGRQVKVVIVGYATCAALLLKTEANHKGDGIPYSGSALVRQKVVELVQMGGVRPGGSDTFNLGLDAEAAVYVEENWPTPIVYSSPGGNIQAGKSLKNPDINPVAKAFELYPEAGPRGVIGNRSCWDEVATIFAVHGTTWQGQEIWKKSPSGRIRFTIRKLTNPANKAKDTAVDTHFDPEPDEGRSYLIQIKDERDTAAMIEELMIQPPATRGQLR